MLTYIPSLPHPLPCVYQKARLAALEAELGRARGESRSLARQGEEAAAAWRDQLAALEEELAAARTKAAEASAAAEAATEALAVSK